MPANSPTCNWSTAATIWKKTAAKANKAAKLNLNMSFCVAFAGSGEGQQLTFRLLLPNLSNESTANFEDDEMRVKLHTMDAPNSPGAGKR